MKVRDLIRELEAFDDEAEVHFSYSYGDHWRSVVAPKCNNVDLGMVIYSQYHSMPVVIDDMPIRLTPTDTHASVLPLKRGEETTPVVETFDLDADVLKAIHAVGATHEPCGSRVTCSPAPTDTDRDYLVVVPDNQKAVADIVRALSELGFKWEGSEHYQNAAGNFMSWRFDHLNLIVTANAEFARRHRAATRICKDLNILHKPHRIAVFQGVLYGDRAKVCGACGETWQDGMSCGQKDNGHAFATCYPVGLNKEED